MTWMTFHKIAIGNGLFTIALGVFFEVKIMILIGIGCLTINLISAINELEDN